MIRSRRLPRPKFDPALPTLRRRTSRLVMGLSPRARDFVRLVPLLLEARFRRPSLDVEPPGVLQPPRRRRWGKLCERLELPPPTSFSQRRPLIASVLLSPRSGGGFELLVIPVEGLAAMEHQRITQRITAMQQLAARSHVPHYSRATANQKHNRLAKRRRLSWHVHARRRRLWIKVPIILDDILRR